MDKDEKIIDLTANKEKMMKDLSEIEEKLKTISFISGEENSVRRSSRPKSGKKVRIRTPNSIRFSTDKEDCNDSDPN